jgi:UDP-glucose 4-epimerase
MFTSFLKTWVLLKTVKYLVTGGAGFIGSHLVERLHNDGHKVTVLDDFSLGREEHKDKPSVRVIKKSICDSLDDVFSDGFDAVFHVAALPRVQFSIKEPVRTFYANVVGTQNVLEHCRNYGVNKFVFSSSSSVYGDQKVMPLNEEMVLNPLSPYASHKLVGEVICRDSSRHYGIKTGMLRYFNVFGPGQSPDGDYACLIPRSIARVLKGEQPIIFGDGKKTRDFTFVDDVVSANIAMLFALDNSDNVSGEVFNIGAGNNVSVNDVVGRIINLSGKSIEPRYEPPKVEPQHTLADISKAKRFLHWSPATDFTEGISKTYDWFSGQQK